jgi:hypothetical protein
VLAVCVQAPNNVGGFYRDCKSFCACEVLFKGIIWGKLRTGDIYWGLLNITTNTLSGFEKLRSSMKLCAVLA